MQWIKTHSAKRWNTIHGSTDHLWGDRFFARIVKEPWDYAKVMDYINQNPVKANLAEKPEDWKGSGAYYVCNNIPGLVDYAPQDHQSYIKLLPEKVSVTFLANGVSHLLGKPPFKLP
jgi:putative transposase